MTKLQTWTEAQEILTNLGLSKKIMASATEKFEALLAPKKAGGASRPEPIEKDGIKYYYCRFTSRYWSENEMVYQNAEKRAINEDKGYSAIGMSLWTKGQKHIKDGMKLATEINFGIIKKWNDKEGDELNTYAIELYKEIEALKAENKGNSSDWLLTFITEEQSAKMAELSIES